MAKTINRGKNKEYIDRPAGIEDNCTLTCLTLAISGREEPTKIGEGAANNTPRKDDILSTDLSENVIIKTEETVNKEENIQK